MGQVISEGLEYIGRIDDNGYVFDKSGHCTAKITDAGYISKVGGGGIFGKIDKDGTIRDASLNVVGRIQADGYVYIHSKRVCRVSSAFIEKLTPGAWNAGQPSTYSGRKGASTYARNDYSNSGSSSFFTSSFFIKLVIGIVLGIIMMVNGLGAGALIACPVIVFMFSFFAKLFG